jgi:hypothetical protein
MPEPSDIPILFSDRPDNPVLDYDRYHLEDVRRQIDDVGFAVVKGLIPKARIERIRSFWIDTFSKVKPVGRVTWSPFLGQANHVGFTSDPFQHLYRACDFLWNDPFHPETRDVCLRVHALRNLVLNQDPYFGMRFTDARYGIFVTASYYPSGTGRMSVHDDGVSGRARLVHSLAPVTFRGKDYKDGGMMVINRRGQDVFVEAELEPGDVVVYDGSLKHGVMPIVPNENGGLGRIQVFPIPTVFGNLKDDTAAIARIPAARIAAAKWLWLKNDIRIKLGMRPAMR